MNQEPRMPPNDKEAERAVLGCALRSKEALFDLMARIEVVDFYHFAHQKLWEAFCHLAAAGKPVDQVTVMDRLKEMKVAVEDIGGYGYIVDIWDGAPAIGNFDHYAGIVMDKAIRRALIEVATAIARKTDDYSLTANELIEQAESELFRGTQRRQGTSELATMQQVIDAALDAMDRKKRRRDGQDGDYLPLGWIDLDKLTGGLQRKELTIVGARPSVGKTAFCLNVIENLLRLDKRVFFASIEQGRSELGERMLSRNAQVSSHHFRHGTFDDRDAEKILTVTEAIGPYRLFVDDAGTQSAARIASQARRLAMKGPLDLVAIDYLSLIEPEDRRAQRYLQVGVICQRMKQLAKDLSVPVMLLAQLSRESEGRRPALKDLRESGDIEQHADTVMLLHRPEEADRNKEAEELEVIVAKQRNGPQGEVTLLFRKRFFDLRNFAPEAPSDGF